MNKKIVELKDKLGLSRASFARALDISPSQMARIEVGEVVLSDEFLQKICSTFHVNPAFFTGEMDIDEALKVVSLEEEMKQVGKRLKQASDASIFIGQVKHLEFDLIRNQSH